MRSMKGMRNRRPAVLVAAILPSRKMTPRSYSLMIRTAIETMMRKKNPTVKIAITIKPPMSLPPDFPF